MKENKEPSQHVGHRQRLTSSALRGGLSALSEIQITELMLFYVYPQRDTNDIAHRLIDEFGSFAGILDARVEDLLKVKGVGEQSAKLIKLMPEFFFFYKENKLKRKTKLNNYEDMFSYFTELLDGKPIEEIYVCALNSANEVISKKKLAHGSTNKVDADVKFFIEFAISNKASALILGHNHPVGDSAPSLSDINSTKSIKQALTTIGVKLFDHIIISKDNTFSFRQNGLI